MLPSSLFLLSASPRPSVSGRRKVPLRSAQCSGRINKSRLVKSSFFALFISSSSSEWSEKEASSSSEPLLETCEGGGEERGGGGDHQQHSLYYLHYYTSSSSLELPSGDDGDAAAAKRAPSHGTSATERSASSCDEGAPCVVVQREKGGEMCACKKALRGDEEFPSKTPAGLMFARRRRLLSLKLPPAAAAPAPDEQQPAAGYGFQVSKPPAQGTRNGKVAFHLSSTQIHESSTTTDSYQHFLQNS